MRTSSARALLRGLGSGLVASVLATVGGSVVAHPAIERQIADTTARIELRPDDPSLFIERGELYRIHRDWDAADADYLRARELDPELDSVDFLMGKARLEADLPEEALKFLDRFLAKRPDHPEARVARARALVALGRPMAAVKDYDRALANFGDDAARPTHYLELARALAAGGPKYLERAVSRLDQGLERLGQPVTLQLYAIELETEMGRYQAALTRLDRVAAKAKRQESWLVRRGGILESAGQAEKAGEAYRAALEAIEALPAGRRGTRAVLRLKEEAETALERLEAEPSKLGTGS